MLPKISTIPPNTGVYIFKNAKEKALYVGKAKNLKNRLRSYFQQTSSLDNRKVSMMREVSDISYIVTSNELEAFVLEANLIKQFRPKFNIILRDDKNYPYLKLTINEEWPKLEVVRKIKKDGALYFGPYVPASSMWETLAFIRKNFYLRHCRFVLDKKIRPCIQYQMGRCFAPCAGYISREEYMKHIDEVRLFLSGKRKDLIGVLKKRMINLSDEMKFEDAAKLRDRIKSIEQVWLSQKVIVPELEDIDIAGFYREDTEVVILLLFIRKGITIGSKDFLIRKNVDVTDSEMMHAFLSQFYSKEIIPPTEIVTSILPDDMESLEMWLTHRRGEQVKIILPTSGKKKELLDMAIENAQFVLRSRKIEKTEEILEEIKEKLYLEKKPESIGAFDVSSISGDEAVGAFVYWADGEFKKDMYRRMKVKSVKTIDDYSMMEEIISRIIGNLGGSLPDLVIIDGGKGHLERASKVIERNINILKKTPSLVAIAKHPDRAFLTKITSEISLEDRSQAALMLKKIRDETHRFAIEYHRKLRSKKILLSPLGKIPGVGIKRRLELLRVFGSIESIKSADVNQIAKLKGFNKKVAEKILYELRRSQ
ncbi:MAG: excinuclease ABC subunit UvrC [Nitrospirae bacterium]|nr:excinuclease ABC subunit UvrC [Nitrospirota bacterium]